MSRVYSFKDITGALVNVDTDQPLIGRLDGAEHIILPLRLARQLMDNAVIDELLSHPVIELYKEAS